MEDTWFQRDLPVLEAVASYFETHGPFALGPRGQAIMDATELDAADVGRAFVALDGRYIKLVRSLSDASSWSVDSITPEARIATGQWPSGDNIVDQITSALAEAADRESDPARKSRLKEVAVTLGGMARDIAVDVVDQLLHRRGL